MGWLSMRGKLTQLIKKYRFAVIVLAVGLLLMLLPFSTDTSQTETPLQPQITEEKEDLSAQLQEILSQIRGAGEVRVLLTQASGERIIYQIDEDRNSDGSGRTETVIITDKEKNQFGLVQQTQSPTYLGAVIVCQGADQPSVRLAIVEAVGNATGLGADKISVITMK